MLNNIRPGGFPEPNTNSYEFRKKKQVKRDFQIGVAVRKTQWLQTFRGFKMCMVKHEAKSRNEKTNCKILFSENRRFIA